MNPLCVPSPPPSAKSNVASKLKSSNLCELVKILTQSNELEEILLKFCITTNPKESTSIEYVTIFLFIWWYDQDLWMVVRPLNLDSFRRAPRQPRRPFTLFLSHKSMSSLKHMVCICILITILGATDIHS